MNKMDTLKLEKGKVNNKKMSLGVNSHLIHQEEGSFRDKQTFGKFRSERKVESASGNELSSLPSSGPYFIGRIQKPVLPQNPLRLSIERKAKKNKEIYLKNQFLQNQGGKVDSQRQNQNGSSIQHVYDPHHFSIRKGSSNSSRHQLRPNAGSHMLDNRAAEHDVYLPKI